MMSIQLWLYLAEPVSRPPKLTTTDDERTQWGLVRKLSMYYTGVTLGSVLIGSSSKNNNYCAHWYIYMRICLLPLYSW
jgi:hypothetical protein